MSALLLSIYEATLQIHIEGEENLLIIKAQKKNYLVAVWHTFVDAAVFALHTWNLVVYSDHPRTAEYEQSPTHYTREIGLKTLRSLGFDIIDASMGKQSAGIINFIKIIKSGRPAMVAPDGPHGPNYEAKPGSIYMALKSNSVVLPVGFGFSRRVVGPNWDDFALPLPFSRVAMVIGEPIEPPLKPTDEILAEYAKQLEDSLDALCFRANDIIVGENGK